MSAPPQGVAPRKREGSVPLAESAYMRIKTAIQEQEFRPGERMREADLAAWLGISRTPMRDALKQLEADGLLEAAPRRGLVVATMDQQRLGEIYALRDVLEALAARLAAQHATQAEIATLERNIARQAETPREDTVSLIRLNRQFHDTIYRASRNRYLVAALHALETPLSLLSGTTYSHPDRPAEALRQHRELAAAIAARQVDLAEAAAREHMLAGERIRLEMLSDLDDWDADGQAG